MAKAAAQAALVLALTAMGSQTRQRASRMREQVTANRSPWSRRPVHHLIRLSNQFQASIQLISRCRCAPRFDPMQFVNNITMVGFIFSALHRIIFISLFGSDRVRRATHWALYVGT